MIRVIRKNNETLQIGTVQDRQSMEPAASFASYETAVACLRRFMHDAHNMTMLRKVLYADSCQFDIHLLSDQEVISQVAGNVVRGQVFIARKKAAQYGGGSSSPSVKEVTQTEGNKRNKTEQIKQFIHEHEIEHAVPSEENWIELEYLYCDGTGVAGASYSVINNEDGSVVAQGSLDGKGYARCALPVSVNNVSYDFSKDPPTVEYLIQPVENPELPKVKEGWFDRMTDGITDAIADGIDDAASWTWGTIQGDFNEDPSTSQIVVNTVITMIPVVDQVGDARDIAANLKLLVWDKRYNDKWVWIALVLTLIGLIPILGSAAKGVLKTVVKGLKTSGKVPLKQLIEVLNTFHKGHAVKWLRNFAADLPGHAAKIRGQFQDILKALRRKLKSLANILPGSLGKKADEMVESIDEVAKVADDKIDEAVKELQDGLNKSLDDKVDFTQQGVTKKNKGNRLQQVKKDPEPDNFIGVLKKEKVALPKVKGQHIDYTKISKYELAKSRKAFNSNGRKKFLESLGANDDMVSQMKKAGLDDVDIQKIKDGFVPSGYQVHHKIPLDGGGTNNFDNLVLIKNDPYHKVITNTQKTLTSGLEAGDKITIDKWPIPEGFIYPAE